MKFDLLNRKELVAANRLKLILRAMGILLCAALFLTCTFTTTQATIVGFGDLNPLDPSTWAFGQDGIIGQYSMGGITIDGGSGLKCESGYLGYYSGSNGTVVITGIGSKWTANSSLNIGNSGTGLLSIEAGGQVCSTTGQLGYNSGSTGTVTITGTGSKWTNSLLYVGNSGNGTLNIKDGGQVSSTTGQLGYNSGSTGTVTITGTGSKWTNSSLLYVGNSGNGTLNIKDGGQVSTTTGQLGYKSGSSGTAVVTGTGAKWTNSGVLYVGGSGNGTLTIEAGGQVSDTDGFLGSNAGSISVATITGAGSNWINNNLYVGSSANCKLTVTDGGTVTVNKIFFGSLNNLYGDGTISTKGVVLDTDLVFDANHGLQQTLAFGTGGALIFNQDGSNVLGAGYKGNGTLRIAEGMAVTSSSGYLGYNSGSTGMTTVTGAGSKWTSSSDLYIGNSGKGTLAIEAGGQVSDHYCYLGYNSNSTGTATITGAGSKWTNSRSLFVGYDGKGTLNIEAGGQVSDSDGFIGNRVGVTSTATVSGTGSQWNNYSDLYIGNGGNGTLHIKAGGLVYSYHKCYIGNGSGTIGIATVSGSGSQLNASGLIVGNSGSAMLRVEAGGQISSSDSYLGYNVGSTCTATVTGANSKWTAGKLYVGYNGSGTLTVSDGGTVITHGELFAGNGTLMVNDSGTVIAEGGIFASSMNLSGNGVISANGAVLDYDLIFDATHGLQQSIPFGTGSHINLDQKASGVLGAGYTGIGTLRITQGLSVTSEESYLGFRIGSTGSATVTGSDSNWKNLSLYIGDSGRGSLNIEAGGQVSSMYGYLGNSANSTGTVTVTGASSQWATSQWLDIGNSGNGTLRIEVGGQVSSNSSSLGINSGSTGTATVAGTGSTWTNRGSLIVGNSGIGTLNIEAGGQVSSNSAQLGFHSGSAGTAVVTGAGSKWTNSGSFYIGENGRGTLCIEAGGQIINSHTGYLGYYSGSSGTVTVNGMGSKWTNSGVVYIGDSGNGTLYVEAGGQANTPFGYLGRSAGSVGTATVTGAGSQWINKELFVGGEGKGTLTINDGGTVVIEEGLYTSLTQLYGNGTISTTGVVLDVDLHFDAIRGSQQTIAFGTGGNIHLDLNGSGVLGAGYSGNGTIEITEGRQVKSSSGYLGYKKGSSGTATVTGLGSQWTNTNILNVGSTDGSGTLNVGSGVGSGGTVISCSLKLTNGNVNINGGTLQVVSIGYDANGTSSFNWYDGIIRNYQSDSGLTINYSQGFVVRLAESGTHAFYIDAGQTGIVGVTLVDASSGGTLVKNGGGRLILIGAHTYSGMTTVEEGALIMTNTCSLASSTINVKGGAMFDVSSQSGYSLGTGKTLTGSGTIIGNVTINGIHAPGNSPGIETVRGNYSMLGKLSLDLMGTEAGTGYDEVFLGGGTGTYNVSLGGTLDLNWNGMIGSTDTSKLWILKNDTAGTLSGMFGNYLNGAALGNYDGRDWYLWYGADATTGKLTGGNDVVIAAVPEPSALILLGMGVCLLISVWRRRTGKK